MENKSPVEKQLDDLISYIQESKEYKNCLLAKKKMSQNKDIINLIEEVKKLQKEYIRSSYKEEVKLKLEEKKEKLYEIPIFLSYMNNLEVVNEMLSTISEELNYYFHQKLNRMI